jgi:hypothetical protein
MNQKIFGSNMDYIFPSPGLETDHMRPYVQCSSVQAVRVIVLLTKTREGSGEYACIYGSNIYNSNFSWILLFPLLNFYFSLACFYYTPELQLPSPLIIS